MQKNEFEICLLFCCKVGQSVPITMKLGLDSTKCIYQSQMDDLKLVKK